MTLRADLQTIIRPYVPKDKQGEVLAEVATAIMASLRRGHDKVHEPLPERKKGRKAQEFHNMQLKLTTIALMDEIQKELYES